MRRYSWRRFLERRMQLAKHQFYHFHSVFSICVDYLFSSATNFRSFSVGSLSIKDLVKVRKLGSMVSLFFFGLHSPFLSAVAFLLPPDNFRGQYFDCHYQIMAQRYSKDLQIPYSLSMGKEYPTVFHSLFPLGNN